uniref:Uncharacterized protein n=1 Tax=Arundo donax TaxID=35708 RepID=A0A0A9FPV2_ARUDO
MINVLVVLSTLENQKKIINLLIFSICQHQLFSRHQFFSKKKDGQFVNCFQVDSL